MGLLNPGTTKPRYDPDGGWPKHREKIHRESKTADDHKNLPFTFSKPKRSKRQAAARCSGCGYIGFVPISTVGWICPECKKYSSVEVLD